MFLVAQEAGNSCEEPRREGRAVLGALGMMAEYKIDRSRIYAAGCSGGARCAGDLAFHQSDLFSATIQDCGSNFYRPVRHLHTQNWTDTNGNPYGLVSTSAQNVHDARTRVRFVLITGSNDFRHGNLLDLYEDGFRQEGFRCKLIDVPGMGHGDCSGPVLAQALDFIEGK